MNLLAILGILFAFAWVGVAWSVMSPFFSEWPRYQGLEWAEHGWHLLYLFPSFWLFGTFVAPLVAACAVVDEALHYER